jgi:protein arginine kinase activator
MQCQICGKNAATNHITKVINGNKEETHLCQKCFAEKGYGNFVQQGLFPNPFGGFLFAPSIKPLPVVNKNAVRCSGCGCTFDDIANSGKAGCAECYKTFFERLLPSLQKIHGKSNHIGKKPGLLRQSEETGSKQEIDLLKQQMNAAAAAYDFEKAAHLRDEIKKLEEAKANG